MTITKRDILALACAATIACVLVLILSRPAASQAPIDLFALPVEPVSASSGKPPIDLFALESPPPAQIDTRPVIDAYSVAYCGPCNAEEKEVGAGNEQYRVRWHHSETGEDFPWHIHNYALRHGYPVHHYAAAGGQWKRHSGRLSPDQLAAIVRK